MVGAAEDGNRGETRDLPRYIIAPARSGNYVINMKRRHVFCQAILTVPCSSLPDELTDPVIFLSMRFSPHQSEVGRLKR